MDKTPEAVRRQIFALGVPIFEVGLYRPDAVGNGQSSMIPRTWDIEALIRSIPWLRFQNSLGRNIYVRPKGEHSLSLVDDLTAEAIARLKATGFSPAVVIETSPQNFQVWLKHSKVLPREASTAAARILAKQFGGDPGAADWRHFGRLAGFTNRKPKYQSADGLFPFVRVMESNGLQYAEGERFVAKIEIKMGHKEDGRSSSAPTFAGTPLKTIERFRENPAYGGDGTRIDLAYAIYALSHGAELTDVEAAIRSRNLSHKGNEKRQSEYVERTIRKAAKAVGRTADLGRN